MCRNCSVGNVEDGLSAGYVKDGLAQLLLAYHFDNTALVDSWVLMKPYTLTVSDRA